MGTVSRFLLINKLMKKVTQDLMPINSNLLSRLQLNKYQLNRIQLNSSLIEDKERRIIINNQMDQDKSSKTLALTQVNTIDNEPLLGAISVDHHNYDAIKLHSPSLVINQQPSWEPTLARVADSIISIRANHVRSFDTESSGAYSATGFIVDAERGLILTNRHVVSPAPIVAMGILSNYEEVTLKPIYRDPVHDFGFFQFDPKQVKFMKLESIPLSPERAKIGLDIRVVGNNAGEKLSILAGTLARLDRKAPNYGKGEYNDFNTFYLQAASGTSGGSSGSPVLDIEGHAVALNAGGSNKASSSYYLPLDRVLYALRFLQQNKPVPRGTLQVEFEHLAYDELRRLGLPSEIERQVRATFPCGTGLLSAHHILPRGPGDNILQSGDMILKVNSISVNSFIKLFEILDNKVNSEIEIEVCRGSKIFNLNFNVQDLHSITPNKFVEIGGGIVNELSYQLARSYGQPVEGVYVAFSGYMFDSASCERRSIIVSINNIPTPNLDEFIKACQTLPDNTQVPIRFYSIEKPFTQKVKLISIDRHWHPFRIAIRDDKSGQWNFKNLSYIPSSKETILPTAATLPHVPRLPGSQVIKSIVTVDFHIPYLIDGMKSTQFYGAGIIIDDVLGLIVCDRDTVPTFIGDLKITFASAIVIPAKILFLHPTCNLAFLKYDPKLIEGTPVESAKFVDNIDLESGDEVYFAGVAANQSLMVKKTSVAGNFPIPAKPTLPPRWRAVNVDGIRLDSIFSSQGGVICNELGHIYALWVNYSYQDNSGRETSVMQGLPSKFIMPTLKQLQLGLDPTVKSLEIELASTKMASVCNLGLSKNRLNKLQSLQQFQHSLLSVVGHLSPDCEAAKLIQVGDIILEANNQPILKLSDIDQLLESLISNTVNFTVLRGGEEISLSVPTVSLTSSESQRIICWSGAILQNPTRAVKEQVCLNQHIPLGPYLSCTLTGSPVETFNISPGVWITHLNDIPVPSLDDFLSVANELKGLSYVRIRTVSRANRSEVVSLKLDDIYWPTWDLKTDNDGEWKFIYH